MNKIYFLFILLLFPLMANAVYETSDCGQASVSVGDLEKIASSPKVKSMQDFLDQIPKSTMPNFTFVTNSLSLQRGSGDGKVSPLWPRVLRATADGKTTISFVCDPRNPNFGKVEVLYLDEASGRIKSVEWDFSKAETPPAGRIHRDPIACISCHQGSAPGGVPSLKFNWPEYFSWGDCQRSRGITLYGANDDFMSDKFFRERYSESDPEDVLHAPKDCNNQSDKEAHLAAIRDFENFRKVQKDNACFNSLPWPAKPGADATPSELEAYRLFPYRPILESDTQRPNLAFTNAFSRIMAKRVFQMIKEHPLEYQRVKYQIALEGAGCPRTSQDEERLQKLLGKKVPAALDGFLDSPETAGPAKHAPVLYGLSRQLGLKDSDWTMEFHVENDPAYNGGDGMIYSFVAGETLKDIARENASVAKAAEGAFTIGGTAPSCLDQVSATIKVRYAGGFGTSAGGAKLSTLCDTLHAEEEKALQELSALENQTPSCFTPAPTAPAAELAKNTAGVVQAFDAAAIARGKKLVQPDGEGKCVLCHSAAADSGLPADFRFVPDENASTAEAAESKSVLRARLQEGFLKTLDQRLIETKTMPPIENQLSAEDREDIKAYLQSLSR